MKSCSNCKKPINEKEATSHHKKKGGKQILCISCHQKTNVHQKFTRKGKIRKNTNIGRGMERPMRKGEK